MIKTLINGWKLTTCSDSDAAYFIKTAGLTGATHQTAICQLVKDLKTNSLWDKLIAVYPFIGATASAHALNLKDPRNLDVSFRLTFTGGFTHSETGCLPDGSSGWAETYLIPSSHVPGTTSISLGYYSRNADSGNRMGFSNASGNRLFLYLHFASGDLTILDCYGTSGGFRASATAAGTAGFLIGSRISSTDSKLFKNGVQIGATQSTTMNNLPSTGSMQMFRQSNGTLYSNWECAFGMIGTGLTSGDVAALNTIVEAYQDTLGRGVQ